MNIRKPVAIVITAALIWLSPGLVCYEAMAMVLRVGSIKTSISGTRVGAAGVTQNGASRLLSRWTAQKASPSLLSSLVLPQATVIQPTNSKDLLSAQISGFKSGDPKAALEQLDLLLGIQSQREQVKAAQGAAEVMLRSLALGGALHRLRQESGMELAQNSGEDHLAEIASISHFLNPEARRLLAKIIEKRFGSNTPRQLARAVERLQAFFDNSDQTGIESIQSAPKGAAVLSGSGWVPRSSGLHLSAWKVRPEQPRVLSNGATRRSGVGLAKSAEIPRTYYWFLGGLSLAAIGDAANTILIPVYAYSINGAWFAVASQSLNLLAILPGSFIGAWLVRRFNFNMAFSGGNLLKSLISASVPVAFLTLGSVSVWHFLLFSAVAGAVYGAQRGVAEQVASVKILGQNKALQEKAGSLYYLVVSPMYFGFSAAIAWLLPFLGVNWLSIIGAAAIFLSILAYSKAHSLSITNHPQEESPSRTTEQGPMEKAGSLPLKEYLPYVFSWVVHLAFYFLFASFLAKEIFSNVSFDSWSLSALFVALYAAGNWLMALAITFRRQWVSVLSKKGWTTFSSLATLGFLWASLWIQSPYLSLALVALMGMGVTANQTLWRADYLHRLRPESQPRVFKWLTVSFVLATLFPFVILQGGLLVGGWSIPLLLTIVAVVFTAAGAALQLVLLRIKRADSP